MPSADPFTILCDTREQAIPPFPDGVRVERATLTEGDYTSPALLDYARIERKSLQDLIGSLTHDRARFMRELERLRGYAFRCVVVEGDMVDVIAGKYRSKVLPQSIVGSICSMLARHECPTIFATNATTCGYVIYGLLRRLEEEQQRAAVRGAA